MLHDSDLPEDLKAFEQELAAFDLPQPGYPLKTKILSAISDERYAEPYWKFFFRGSLKRRLFWKFFLGLSFLGLLLGLNLIRDIFFYDWHFPPLGYGSQKYEFLEDF